jgi:hypothetical protein
MVPPLAQKMPNQNRPRSNVLILEFTGDATLVRRWVGHLLQERPEIAGIHVHGNNRLTALYTLEPD